ncbi:LysR substrate-binding domain-containing protein [Undibacterium sp.]|jgi:LysR family glycine cleavage system transcriptional activator|uniref:LysR substrate-binding domain-containing protein n=1 Tax=Undibacterium sp. TaxID=1914977 RepID=UPI002BE03CD0|nr:LysR substrate-binding domain-containing protein [Undibacterium sp.]HTD03589.1 LysR substrate-binding domain-containing protein [Undibacterium sp.]
MARSLPPLKALKAFESAARTGNLTLAAAELHVTHSAVSQQLKLLEEHFGQALFTRGPRGVQPTDAALQFYTEVKASLDRIAYAAEQLHMAGKNRVIQVNTTPSIAMRWLIPRLSSFQIENPRIEIRVTTSASDAVADLKEPYDVIIRREAHQLSGYECVRFLDDVSAPLASRGYLERKPITRPEDLCDASLLHLESRLDAWSRWLTQAGVAPPNKLGGHVYQHFFLSLQAASANLGVAMGSLELLEDDLDSGRLIQLFPDIVLKDVGFHMMFRSPAGAGSPLATFTNWLQLMGSRPRHGRQ